MKKIITTKSFTCVLENNLSESTLEDKKTYSSKRIWTIDEKDLQAGLDKLCRLCNEHGFEIKSILPLTRSESSEYSEYDMHLHSESGAGYGYGRSWATSMNAGFVALLQRIIELPNDEYEAYQGKIQSLKDKRDQVADKVRQIRRQAEELEHNVTNTYSEVELHREKIKPLQSAVSRGVEKPSGFFSGGKIKFASKSYNTEKAANADYEEAKELLGRNESDIKAQIEGVLPIKEEAKSLRKSEGQLLQEMDRISIEIGDDKTYFE